MLAVKILKYIGQYLSHGLVYSVVSPGLCKGEISCYMHANIATTEELDTSHRVEGPTGLPAQAIAEVLKGYQNPDSHNLNINQQDGYYAQKASRTLQGA